MLLLQQFRHAYCSGNITLLISFCAAAKQYLNNFTDAGEINPVTRAEGYSHLRHLSPDRLAVPEVAAFKRTDSFDDSSFAFEVFELGKPCIKGFCTKYAIHFMIVSFRIQNCNENFTMLLLLYSDYRVNAPSTPASTFRILPVDFEDSSDAKK